MGVKRWNCSAYLYTLASLAMTFAGFRAMVIVLRQAGKDISDFHIVLTRIYLESGLFSAAFCMLPPFVQGGVDLGQLYP